MKAKLIGRGFLNKLKSRGKLLFADVSIQQGREYVNYSVLVDKKFASELLEIAGNADLVAEYFNKKPVLLCIVNPVTAIEGGEIVRSGILLGFTDYALTKDGSLDESIFSILK